MSAAGNRQFVQFKNWGLDLRNEVFFKFGQPQRLQPGIMAMLLHLVRNESRAVSKQELVTEVWGGRAVSDGALYSRANALRRVIEDTDDEERCIRWIYSKGLVFDRPKRADLVTEPNLNLVNGDPQTHPVAALLCLLPQAGVLKAESIETFRHLVGAYFSYYSTPSWPGFVKCGLSILSEAQEQIVVRTLEYGSDESIGIRQRARYCGIVHFIDGRLYILEQNTRHPKAVCLITLDPPQESAPDIMTGMMLGSSWRLNGAPYGSRVIWKRVPDELTIRDALRASGPFSSNDLPFDKKLCDQIASDSFTFCKYPPVL